MAITIRSLKALTAPFAHDLAMRGVAAPVLDGIRPGGAENPARDAHAWLRYYGRLMALRSAVERGGDGGGVMTTEEAAADTVILAALAGEAKPIRLSANEHAGERLAVYPKSGIALVKAHVRNLEIGRLLSYVDRLGASDDPRASTLTERALVEVLYLHRVLAWIACTPGPGLPFPEVQADPELPELFRDLAPQDLLTICRVFDEVNWARLRALELLMAPDPDEHDAPSRRPSWSQFFGSLAASEGRASEDVLRDRSLVGLLATMKLAASAQRQATADAKAKARSD
jgi:hypothetical protein